jgi:hypothetical protein
MDRRLIVELIRPGRGNTPGLQSRDQVDVIHRRPPPRLRDLITAKASLRVQCGFCITESELDVVALVCKLGPDPDVRGMEKRHRLKCREGGHSSLSLTWF